MVPLENNCSRESKVPEFSLQPANSTPDSSNVILNFASPSSLPSTSGGRSWDQKGRHASGCPSDDQQPWTPELDRLQPSLPDLAADFEVQEVNFHPTQNLDKMDPGGVRNASKPQQQHAYSSYSTNGMAKTESNKLEWNEPFQGFLDAQDSMVDTSFVTDFSQSLLVEQCNDTDGSVPQLYQKHLNRQSSCSETQSTTLPNSFKKRVNRNDWNAHWVHTGTITEQSSNYDEGVSKHGKEFGAYGGQMFPFEFFGEPHARGQFTGTTSDLRQEYEQNCLKKRSGERLPTENACCHNQEHPKVIYQHDIERSSLSHYFSPDLTKQTQSSIPYHMSYARPQFKRNFSDDSTPRMERRIDNLRLHGDDPINSSTTATTQPNMAFRSSCEAQDAALLAEMNQRVSSNPADFVFRPPNNPIPTNFARRRSCDGKLFPVLGCSDEWFSTFLLKLNSNETFQRLEEPWSINSILIYLNLAQNYKLAEHRLKTTCLDQRFNYCRCPIGIRECNSRDPYTQKRYIFSPVQLLNIDRSMFFHEEIYRFHSNVLGPFFIPKW